MSTLLGLLGRGGLIQWIIMFLFVFPLVILAYFFLSVLSANMINLMTYMTYLGASAQTISLCILGVWVVFGFGVVDGLVLAINKGNRSF